MQLLLKGGRIIDPSQDLDKIADLLVKDGKIKRIQENIDPQAEGLDSEEIIQLKGKAVVPGLVDMHVHFREPGFEHKETILTGSRAAIAGGFTSVAAMPNTNPVTDCRAVVEYILQQAKAAGLTRVYPIGALTKNLKGEEMAEIGDMIEGGAIAFSDDAFPIANSGLMRRVMEYCAMFDVPVILHCEDESLKDDGLMNEGLISTKLGLRGIPHESEEISISRNVTLAKLTGCRTHIAHVSTSGSVDIIRQAKEEGAPVTCETCPQYFTLTEEAIVGYNTNAKMSPPLRTADDVQEIKNGLADGTIDIITTDHAPHALEDKDCEFAAASNGIVGLETSLGLVLTELVKPGILTLTQAVKKMSFTPSKILRLAAGTLAAGSPADITVIDLESEWTVDPSAFRSKGRNTPFAGRKLGGMPVMTIVGGTLLGNSEQAPFVLFDSCNQSR